MAGILDALGTLGNRNTQINNMVNNSLHGQAVNNKANQVMEANQANQAAAGLMAQKAYQEQQAIENSPEFINSTLAYYKKNPGAIQYEKDGKIQQLLIDNGLMEKPKSFSSIFGFGG